MLMWLVGPKQVDSNLSSRPAVRIWAERALAQMLPGPGVDTSLATLFLSPLQALLWPPMLVLRVYLIASRPQLRATDFCFSPLQKKKSLSSLC